jgi:hypothetical protein
MGMFEKAKNFVTGGSSEPDFGGVDVDDEFNDAVGGEGSEEQEQESESEPEPEPDEGPGPWDSAYDFAWWYLEPEGFASMEEFGEKAMMLKLQNSPMFRDRIETGMETLQMVNQAKQQFDEIQGKDKGSHDYEQMADKLENANRVIDGMKSLNGEEEMMVQEGMSLARDAIEAIGNRASGGTGSNVDTSMTRSDRDI